MSTSEQETPILALKQAVHESTATIEFVMEESLAEQHQSHGTMEVTMRDIQKQIRVMKNSLEGRWNSQVPPGHPILVVPRSARRKVDVKVSVRS